MPSVPTPNALTLPVAGALAAWKAYRSGNAALGRTLGPLAPVVRRHLRYRVNTMLRRRRNRPVSLKPTAAWRQRAMYPAKRRRRQTPRGRYYRRKKKNFRKAVIRAVHGRERRYVQTSNYLAFSTRLLVNDTPSDVFKDLYLGRVQIINFINPAKSEGSMPNKTSYDCGTAISFPGGGTLEDNFTGAGYFLKGFLIKGYIAKLNNLDSITLCLCRCTTDLSIIENNDIRAVSDFYTRLPNDDNMRYPGNMKMQAGFKIIKRIVLQLPQESSKFSNYAPFKMWIPVNKRVPQARDAGVSVNGVTVPHALQTLGKLFWMIHGHNMNTPTTTSVQLTMNCDLDLHFADLQ